MVSQYEGGEESGQNGQAGLLYGKERHMDSGHSNCKLIFKHVLSVTILNSDSWADFYFRAVMRVYSNVLSF